MMSVSLRRPLLSVVTRAYSSAAPHGASAQAAGKVPPASEMPDIMTGREKFEHEAGPEPYGETVLHGAFGTPEKPVIVKSVFDSRIVGCVGSKTNEHELIWHVVSHRSPLICLECGQAFKLQKVEDSHGPSHH